MSERKLLKIGEAAKRLQVSPDSLRKWEQKGWISPHRTPGGHRRYVESDLVKKFITQPPKGTE